MPCIKVGSLRYIKVIRRPHNSSTGKESEQETQTSCSSTTVGVRWWAVTGTQAHVLGWEKAEGKIVLCPEKFWSCQGRCSEQLGIIGLLCLFL